MSTTAGCGTYHMYISQTEEFSKYTVLYIGLLLVQLHRVYTHIDRSHFINHRQALKLS